MSILAPKYISADGVRHLKNYRYSATDPSYLSDLHQPFWEWVTSLLPRWLAPNLVTLFGLFCVFASFLLHTACASWIDHSTRCLLSALFIFLYQTLDAVDGKQARRTKSGSPLGQLFDHCCDSMSIGLLSHVLLSAVMQPPTEEAILIHLALFVAFWFSTWEEYHTHTMYFGYIGVTEALVLQIGAIALTGVMGPTFWDKSVSVYIPHFGELSATLRRLMVTTLPAVNVVLNMAPGAVIRVARSSVRRRRHTMDVAMRQHASFFTFIAASAAWFTLSPQAVFAKNADLCMALLSLVFFNLTARLIVAHLTREPYAAVQWSAVPFVLASVSVAVPAWLGAESLWNGHVPLWMHGAPPMLREAIAWILRHPQVGAVGALVQSECDLVVALLLWYAVASLRFAAGIITQITDVLGIRCFVIRTRDPVEEMASPRQAIRALSRALPKDREAGRIDSPQRLPVYRGADEDADADVAVTPRRAIRRLSRSPSPAARSRSSSRKSPASKGSARGRSRSRARRDKSSSRADASRSPARTRSTSS